ncbi:MAG: hypothetical protein KDI36_19930, partial [Pseudomonadales bacterium]|nr:hypothetical protein [Pseudomonadales bacterium]
EKSYFSLLKLLETRITALVRLNKLRLQGDISDKARAILAALVGAVAIARSIDDQEEQRRILSIAQNQILDMIGATESAVFVEPTDLSLTLESQSGTLP